MSKAVVLHSGGLDSTALIEKAIEDGATEILALSIKYGSLHNEAEGAAAADIIQWYRQDQDVVKFERLSYSLPADIFAGEASALMGEISMPHLTYQQITESKGPSPTVVPFRNANLISIATAIADARGYNYVYIGAHGEDAHEWAYPDCTPEFLGAMANAIYVGTYQKVRLVFPFIWMMKSDIVLYAAQQGAPIEMSWSCYNPKVIAEAGNGRMPEWMHCGNCPTCIERAHAFAIAGFVDPTSYYTGLDSILGSDYNTDDLEYWGI